MAYPTVHWRRFSGTLGAGARVTLAHGLRDGQFPVTLAAVHAIHFDMSSGVYTEPPNVSIGEYQARTTTNFYLSNFDGAAQHFYGVIARRYHTIDSANV